MKKLLSLVLALAMAFTLAACGSSASTSSSAPSSAGASGGSASSSSASGKTYDWRIACVTAEDHPMTKACMDFADKVSTATDGRVKITVYYAKQLGDDREITEQVMNGSLEMAFPSAGPVGNFSPKAYAYQLPFMVTNWDQYLSLSQSDEAAALLDGIGSDLGCKALATWNSGFRHLLSVDKPINSPEVTKGLKFRVAETQLHIDIFKALGGSPTVIAYGDIYTSLQNKVIDALEMDIPAILMEKHYEVAKYLTLTGHFTWPGICLINQACWDSLSKEDQAAFEQAAEETLQDNVKYVQQVEDEDLKELESNGVQVTQMSDEMLSAFKDAEKPVIDKYSAMDPLIANYYNKAISLQ
ncbi:MAG: TRAP transporter substrate-binding protein [Oscillibacter sp.]|nr:TRAP transporter substrate-binding protein [Oscillibacter sp.]